MAARLPPLPIDEVLADVVRAVGDGGAAVVVAPPGAGKTTRVPPAILDARLAEEGEVIVVQPRRLAARMAAARVARERGVPLGGEVGYEVRFDRKAGRDTRIRFVTEGILVRRLLGDPTLAGVGCVVLDEIHERHVDGDLALAWIAELRRGPRPDLRVVAMSATVEAEPVAAFLGDCPVVTSEGRAYPVEVDYLDHPDDRRVEAQVTSALYRAFAGDAGGHTLVFLPGAGEIRRAIEAAAEVAARKRLELLPLYGDLPAAEQDRAVAGGGGRKVVFATNVAETSITIDGVTCVIDTGTARVARHDPWSGVPTLRVEPVSRASAEQRAGRAGRTRPGRCLRLYTRHDFETRRAAEVPEILRVDLAGVALTVRALGGGRRLGEMTWLDRPEPAAAEAAEELLARLGAVDAAGALTEIGRRMLRFPVHPRQARLIVEAEQRGVAGEGAAIAALLGQRDLCRGRRRAAVSGPSDLLDDLDVLDGARASAVDRAVVAAVRRARSQLARLADRRAPRPPDDVALDAALRIATLTAYPDRVARRRRPGAPEVVFAGGGSGTLAESSVVTGATLMVAASAEERGRGAARTVLVRKASAVDAAWLLDLYIDRVDERDELVWNPERERVERVQRILYDDLVIDESRDPAGASSDPEGAAAILAREALAAGIERFVSGDELAAFTRRVAFVAAQFPDRGLAAISGETLADALTELCTGLASFRELRGARLLDYLRARLGDDAAFVDRMAPTHIALPRRRRCPVHYETDRPPWIESRLQDFFGLETGPTIAGGRVPLVLHLLAPNFRAVQVTTDLAGFWDNHYPALKRQLSRRYPKHHWPDDPRAQPHRRP